MEEEKPIINCHTHIFLGGHVPPYLAKTFVPWPIYYIFNTRIILRLLGVFVQRKNKSFKDPEIAKRRKKNLNKIWLQHNPLVNLVYFLFKGILGILAFIFLYQWINSALGPSENLLTSLIDSLVQKLSGFAIARILFSTPFKILVVVVVFLLFKSVRNAIFYLLKLVVKGLAAFPGKTTKDLLNRYILLGRFTIYKEQSNIFSTMKMQYDPNTQFVVLPMDMEYMEAGKLKEGFGYRSQMNELAHILEGSTNRDFFLPFVFIEPRRIPKESDFIIYNTANYNEGKVQLDECFVKDFVEKKGFFGFKIYPALGYYPFDERLLPLWKYAADRSLPIMTHCIKGTIYYRGKKREEWNRHPIFQEVVHLEKQEYNALLLPQSKNIDFSLNFTHPLNYLVLLKEELLRILVSDCDQSIKKLFGYNGLDQPMDRDLSHLKICFAHFGGDDQWTKFLERDRYRYSNEIITDPDSGINFLYTKKGKFSWKRLEDCWKYVDWYSIICSMMLQHENVYADISYILHDKTVLDLLKHTVDTPKLGDKVLFGTDFYVVRNHLSEKNLHIQTRSNLTEEQFNKIARENTNRYLYI